MNFVYIAPRYHTNQVEIVRYLIDIGHKVTFLAERLTPSDDNTVLSPIMLKESTIYKLFIKPFSKISSLSLEDYKIRHNVPSIRHLFKLLKRERYDIAIIRGNFYSVMICNIILRICGIKNIILYNQVPLYRNPQQIRSPKEKLKASFLPPKRMTPVLYSNCSKITGLIKDPCAYYVPFVATKNGCNRKVLGENKIRILDVGKYRSYKNHTLLVEAIKLLTEEERKRIAVTIVGQCYTDAEKRYKEDLENMIHSKELDDIFRLLENYEHKKMITLYAENDFFILTSKVEVASISVIESMSMGLIPISTDANGTASYIHPSCGYTFKSDDPVSLCAILRTISDISRNVMTKMQNKNVEICQKHYSGDSYLKSIMDIIK